MQRSTDTEKSYSVTANVELGKFFPEKAKVTGWVRNERDGTVTAEAQGDSEGQLTFVRRLTQIVPGFGNDWTVASEERLPLVEGETSFRVRR